MTKEDERQIREAKYLPIYIRTCKTHHYDKSRLWNRCINSPDYGTKYYPRLRLHKPLLK